MSEFWKERINKACRGEPKDVCSICGTTQTDGTMADITATEFDLVCRKCRPDRYTKNGQPKYNDRNKS